LVVGFPSNNKIFSSCVTFNEFVHTHTCEDLILWFWHTRFSEGSDFNSNKDYREVTKPQFHFIYTLMLSHITSCTSTWFQLFSSDKDIPKVAGHGQDSWKRGVDGFSYFRWFSIMLFSNQNHLCYMIYQSPPPSFVVWKIANICHKCVKVGAIKTTWQPFN
jgi:hypothetical protein